MQIILLFGPILMLLAEKPRVSKSEALSSLHGITNSNVSQRDDIYRPYSKVVKRSELIFNKESDQPSTTGLADPNSCIFPVLNISIGKLCEIKKTHLLRTSRTVDICKIDLDKVGSREEKLERFSVDISVDKRRWERLDTSDFYSNDLGKRYILTPKQKKLAHYIWLDCNRVNNGKDLFDPITFYTYFTDTSYMINQRNVVEHPPDGRLLYYDVEDVDQNYMFPVVMDRGILANDAMLKGKSSRIIDLHGSCRHVIQLNGSDDRLEFYSNNIVFRPKLKISIVFWIKPTDFDEKSEYSPLFVITGMHPEPLNSFIRIDRFANASIRVQHRSENGSFVFNISSDPKEANINEWTHIGFTYNSGESEKGEARLYINGTLKYRASGSGYVSKDWDGYAGIGNDGTGRSFIGFFDEIMVFDRILSPQEMLETYKKCHFEKYYTGETIKTDHGIILSPGYPNLYTEPIVAHWNIIGSNEEIVALFIEELKIGGRDNCDRSNLIIRELTSRFLIQRICDGFFEKKTIVSSTNSISIDFESSGEPEGIKYKIKFNKKPKSLVKRQKVSSDTLKCESTGTVEKHIDRDIKIFTLPVGYANGPNHCIYMSCVKYNINHALFLNNFCYAFIDGIKRSAEKGELTSLLNLEDSLTGLSNKTEEPSRYKTCHFGSSVRNVVFIERKSINVNFVENIFKTEDCKNYCCAQKEFECDGIIMYTTSCYVFNCGGNGCRFRPTFGTNTRLSFYFVKKNNDEQTKKIESREDHCRDFWPKRGISLAFVDKTVLRELYSYKYLGRFSSEKACLDLCCRVQKLCDLLLVQEDNCFSLSCVSDSECNVIGENRLNSIDGFKSLYLSNNYIKRLKDASEEIGCSTSKIVYNEIFKRGLEAGNFVNLGRVSADRDCPKMVCNFVPGNSLAFQLGQHCFAVACHNDQSCETASIEEKVESSTYLPTIIWYFQIKNASTQGESDLGNDTKKLEIVTNNLHACYSGNSFQGVNIASIDTDQEFASHHSNSMEDCVASCCDKPECQLALLNGSTCYSLACKNTDQCVVHFEQNEQPLVSVTSVVRSSDSSLINLDSMATCQNFSLFVIHNASLTSIPLSTLRFLGLVKSVNECAQKCCIRYYCDTAYVVGYSCYGLLCGTDLSLCEYNKTHRSQVPSYILYNLKYENKVSTMLVTLEYITIIFLILIATVIGIVISVKMCAKRKRTKKLYRSYRDSDD